MRGVVAQVSAINGFIAIRTDADEYTVAELLGCEVEVGDQLEGDLDALGGETFRNTTSGERCEVFVQDIHATREGAARMLHSR